MTSSSRAVFVWTDTETRNCCHASIRIVWSLVWKVWWTTSKGRLSVRNVEPSTEFHTMASRASPRTTPCKSSSSSTRKSQVIGSIPNSSVVLLKSKFLFKMELFRLQNNSYTHHDVGENRPKMSWRACPQRCHWQCTRNIWRKMFATSATA